MSLINPQSIYANLFHIFFVFIWSFASWSSSLYITHYTPLSPCPQPLPTSLHKHHHSNYTLLWTADTAGGQRNGKCHIAMSPMYHQTLADDARYFETSTQSDFCDFWNKNYPFFDWLAALLADCLHDFSNFPPVADCKPSQI